MNQALLACTFVQSVEKQQGFHLFGPPCSICMYLFINWWIWISLNYLVIDVQQADVLVNVVASKTPDWLRAGTVAGAFLDATGDELQDVRIRLFFILTTTCGERWKFAPTGLSLPLTKPRCMQASYQDKIGACAKPGCIARVMEQRASGIKLRVWWAGGTGDPHELTFSWIVTVGASVSLTSSKQNREIFITVHVYLIRCLSDSYTADKVGIFSHIFCWLQLGLCHKLFNQPCPWCMVNQLVSHSKFSGTESPKFFLDSWIKGR